MLFKYVCHWLFLLPPNVCLVFYSHCNSLSSPKKKKTQKIQYLGSDIATVYNESLDRNTIQSVHSVQQQCCSLYAGLYKMRCLDARIGKTTLFLLGDHVSSQAQVEQSWRFRNTVDFLGSSGVNVMWSKHLYFPGWSPLSCCDFHFSISSSLRYYTQFLFYFYLPLLITSNYSSTSDLSLGFLDFCIVSSPLCYLWTCLFGLLNCFYLFTVDLRDLQSLGVVHRLFWFFLTSVFFYICVLQSFSCSMTLTSYFSSRLFHIPLRLQRRSDGGRPWQAAGVLWDPLRLISHSTFTWPGERGRLQQQRRQFGSSGGDAAQWRAGSGQAVCPRGDHSAGHPQHCLWEVRHNADVQSIFS